MRERDFADCAWLIGITAARARQVKGQQLTGQNRHEWREPFRQTAWHGQPRITSRRMFASSPSTTRFAPCWRSDFAQRG